MFSSHISRYLANSRCLRTLLSRNLSKERAGKGVRPGVALLINDSPHKVMKIIQGKVIVIHRQVITMYLISLHGIREEKEEVL